MTKKNGIEKYLKKNSFTKKLKKKYSNEKILISTISEKQIKSYLLKKNKKRKYYHTIQLIMHKLKIIAEVSSNHNKDLERCKRFIRVSKKLDVMQ